MSPLTVLLVDDEPLARSGARVLLERDPEIGAIHEAADGSAAIEAIRRLAPDFVLLDVQMPVATGLDVVARVGAKAMPPVVFVTAYDAHAVKAFELCAVDYLLKPYSNQRFLDAVAKAKSSIRTRRDASLAGRLEQLLGQIQSRSATEAAAAAPSRRITLKTGTDLLWVDSDAIRWIEADGDYVKVHTTDRIHLARDTLSRLESVLDRTVFVRVHRSALVNRGRIQRLRAMDFGDSLAVLDDGTEIRVSRTYRDRLVPESD